MNTTNTRRYLTAAMLALAAAFITGSSMTPPIDPSQEREKPLFSEYRGVSIAMPMDAAREKLGTPRDKSGSQDLYVFSDNEAAQVYYDASRTVSAITVTFTGNLDKAPSPKAVFGDDVEAKPDGGIFKMVRYPAAGYWVSYNKIVGDDPMIMIAIKKI